MDGKTQGPVPRAVDPDLVLLGCSVLWLPLANVPFLRAALQAHAGEPAGAWPIAVALAVAVVALHVLLLGLLAWGWAFKPVVTLLLLVSATAGHFIGTYGVFIDAGMLRNVLNTHMAEVREFLNWGMLPALLFGVALPAWVLWRLPLKRRPLVQVLARRLVLLGAAVLVLGTAILAVSQPMSMLVRNHPELRHLVTPANVVLAGARLARSQAHDDPGELLPVGLDARAGPAFIGRARPVVLVLVVGEAARAANWGLNGYARQTTPELARLPVINFPRVTSCGTDTETSLPCMFAAVGRRNYDEQRVRRSENLLHVLARAGVAVSWRDNQSGCKGVCEGFPQTLMSASAPPALCRDGQCLDEALLLGLIEGLPQQRGMQFIVLHQIGNHGPAYHRRAPENFRRYQPACAEDELHRCSNEAIVNAYDNALLYTDHVLARLIGDLQSLADRVDSAVVYVSDHGESLGEQRLYLHSMPYVIAPRVQTEVPMVMWMSGGFATARGLDAACLARRALQPASHDHLFHTVLGLLDVQTRAREPTLDLTHDCTSARATGVN